MEIKVLGSGCKNCKKLLDHVKQAVEEIGITAEIEYITDYVEIAKAGILRTPGLMINNKIVSSGRVVSQEEIKKMLDTKVL